ncbi:hypothetical protein [Roseivirga seohaensis]|uniref:hypothetical protein n=1 Tax=Roseivirga seohaensis TaxID=1914963 RepID=UPI003BAA66D7
MEKLNKITLIIGPEDSGKTYLANQLLKAYMAPLFVEGRSKIKRFLEAPIWVESLPDVVLVDDLKAEELLYFYPVVSTPIQFDIRCKKTPDPIFIPWIITSTMTTDQLPKGPSFDNRFNVIDLTPLQKAPVIQDHDFQEKFTAWALDFFHPEGENLRVRLIKNDVRLSFVKSINKADAQITPQLFTLYLLSFFREYGYQLNPHIRGNRCIEEVKGISTEVLYVVY